MQTDPRPLKVNEDASLDVYLKEIARYEPLSREDEAKMAERIREGDQEAKHILVRANLRFVVSIAKQYAHRGLSLTDLINEGNVGLMEAARRFDPSRGCKFISYAVWWIRQAILQALADQSRMVRLPLNRVAELRKIHKAEARLERSLHRPPTWDEVAREMGMQPEDVRKALERAATHVSLDSPLSDDNDAPLVEAVEDAEAASPEEAALQGLHRISIEKALEVLLPREREIVSLYFGLDSERSYTLEEIGRQMGLTRERVRQLKERALWRLRESEDAARLQALLN